VPLISNTIRQTLVTARAVVKVHRTLPDTNISYDRQDGRNRYDRGTRPILPIMTRSPVQAAKKWGRAGHIYG